MGTNHIATLRQDRPGATLATIGAAALLGFGATLLAISLAYVRDLAALRRAPAAVWQFVCGTLPANSDGALPLVLGLGMLALLLGAALLLLTLRARPAGRA